MNRCLNHRFAVPAALCLIFSASAAVSAASQKVTLQYQSLTGGIIPGAVTLADIAGRMPVGFVPNWDSLRVSDVGGKEVPFQIDDMDISKSFTDADELAFLYRGPVTLSVSDGTASPARYPSAWMSIEKDGSTAVSSTDGMTGFSINNAYGIVSLETVNGKALTWARNLGLIRCAGFPDANYGSHAEGTTLEASPKVLLSSLVTNAPVRATAMCLSESAQFRGLRFLTAVSVYVTGDVRVKSSIVATAPVDLTKAQFIATDILADATDARHLMPVGRYLDWAEESGKTPSAYWKEQGALFPVDGKDYVLFDDIFGPTPLFWGARYIFASPERWRTNYSEALGTGMAEMLMDVPAMGVSLEDKLKGESWHLEGEWRTGFFRWVAGEIVSNREQANIAVSINPDMAGGDWALHLAPGGKVTHTLTYAAYKAANPKEAVKYLEARHAELSSLVMK